MSRLTARTETGHAYLVNIKPDEQEVDSPRKNTFQCILDCFERLAAYEDTGLTPGECAEYQKFEDELVSSGITFKRVLELAEADKNGRLVEVESIDAGTIGGEMVQRALKKLEVEP